MIILVCFCALTVLSSCDFVLDMIFGPIDSTVTPDGNQPPAHVHKMTVQTLSADTCKGRQDITYYKCSDCGKCYLDEKGETEIADVTNLQQGHLYVVKTTPAEHYSECTLCQTEKDDSRQPHSSEHWWYSPSSHYKLCDVCGYRFDEGEHDETGSCSVCGRQADYDEMCKGDYGYSQLAVFSRSAGMQRAYSKIEQAVRAVHNNANVNVSKRNLGKDDNGLDISGYALSDVDVYDCEITVGEAYIAVASFTHDNPLYYWLGKRCVVTYQQTAGDSRPAEEKRAKEIVLLVVDDYANGNSRTTQNKFIYNEIDRYMSAVSNENDPYFVTLGLHDKIIDNVSYAVGDDGAPEDAHWAHSVAGVFVNMSAVCEGYAKAFQLLLNACGVDNVYVTGRSHDVGHAWNLAKLSDGKWYWYDLTWDDKPGSVNGKSHDYFCQPDSVFSADHTVTVTKQGLDYLYDMPDDIAESDYDGAWTVDGEVTLQGVTYTLIGYDRLAVTKVLTSGGDSGKVVLPEAVTHNGVTLPVKQINAEAFVTYTYDGDKVVSQASPVIYRLVIPRSVDIIHNRSLSDCSTLVSVTFEDTDDWCRYGLNGKAPVYEGVSAEELQSDFAACKLLKAAYFDETDSKHYYCVWIKMSA